MPEANENGTPTESQTDAATEDQGTASAGTALTEDAAPEAEQQTEQAESEKAAGTALTDDAAEDEQEADEFAELYGAPESYGNFELPDGVPVDEAGLAEFQEWAKSMNLSQKGAQKVVEFELQRQARAAENAVAEYTAQQQEWVKQLQSDKEIGGPDYAKKQAIARQFVKKYGDDEFRTRYGAWDSENNPNGTGLGNDPVLVRMFYRAAMDLVEDEPLSGNKGDSAPKGMTLAERHAQTTR